MSKLHDAIQSVRAFVDEVVQEVKKSTWPERQELIESTVVVIVSILLLAFFVGVSDKILVSVFKFIVGVI